MANAVHDVARSLFKRMIGMGRASEISIKVIAFWSWLEPRGFEKILEKISRRDDQEFLALVADEAEAVLTSLKMDSEKSVAPNLMRLTLNLAQRFLSPTLIFSDRENVLKGIAEIYDELCSPEGFGGEKAQETSSMLPCMKFELNPCAKEWNPLKEKAPAEDRCLFLTFSNGYPLTESQIIKFFTWKYGECVERVYVHRQEMRNGNKMPPLFGKVVFKASYIPALILGGQNEAKFWVDRRPLWCKRFDPDKTKTAKNH